MAKLYYVDDDDDDDNKDDEDDDNKDDDNDEGEGENIRQYACEQRDLNCDKCEKNLPRAWKTCQCRLTFHERKVVSIDTRVPIITTITYYRYIQLHR